MPATDRHPIRVVEELGGAAWRVQLCASRANVLDGVMVRALTDTFTAARRTARLRAVVLDSEGPNFSFGASVEEHLPEQVADMLATFHGLFRAMADSAVVLLAAVRGQCLGGGLELASFCHRVVAGRDAVLGQPEIRLGVFAPMASVLLPARVGRPVAERLCLSGQPLVADDALRCGLVDEVADDPGAAALGWVRDHLAGHSAAALRHAVRALRSGFHDRLFADLRAVERLYLDELMRTADAAEGLRAFLDKRPPQWRHA